LAGKPLIYHVIERAKAIKHVSAVVLAVPDDPSNAPLIDIAAQCGIEVFSGSEDNVLERYYRAAKKFGSDFIIRITGDNPFTDPEYASMAIEIVNESNADLTSITNLPIGTAVEVISMTALEQAYHSSATSYQLEHVTPYIKEHPEFFTIDRHPIQINNPFDALRLTVDTGEDHALASAVFNALYREGQIFSINEVITYLQEHPELVEINRHVEQRPMTHSETIKNPIQ
jgi:spore coat polysaccharide biosynthesis protein SpsF